jgi:hypothetical protein
MYGQKIEPCFILGVYKHNKIPSIQLTLIVVAFEESSPKTELLPPVTSGAHTDSMTLSWVTWTLLSYYNGFKKTNGE